jgi:hypothetical protein
MITLIHFINGEVIQKTTQLDAKDFEKQLHWARSYIESPIFQHRNAFYAGRAIVKIEFKGE